MNKRNSPKIDAADLSNAIGAGHLTLAYQPKVALGSNDLVGVEALARWRHPGLGPIPPSDFIPLAEASGLIDRLTEWVVGRAAGDWTAWRAKGLTTAISVNVSAKSLDRLEFPDLVAGICRKHGMPGKHLMIELTESATQEVVKLLDTLTRFRIKGMGIALDDFGTGDSSLAQLAQLPFSELKIDKSFVMGADGSKDSRVIVQAIVDLGHNLGMQVVAEGVETKATAEFLVGLGCDIAQGYYFAKPMSAGELLQWALVPPAAAPHCLAS
jgi:EAL domain-containing protein (putative c-di-GMP-specific phosphodiesterase class I)